MPTYLVSYDLNQPPQHADYHPLVKRIRDDWHGERVLYSEWFVRTKTTQAAELRDDLSKYIDSNDGLIVLGLTGEAAWTGNTLKLSDDKVKQLLAA
jgi:CRISPR/Cas system-associated endoribonuclease Cas2